MVGRHSGSTRTRPCTIRQQSQYHRRYGRSQLEHRPPELPRVAQGRVQGRKSDSSRRTESHLPALAQVAAHRTGPHPVHPRAQTVRRDVLRSGGHRPSGFGRNAHPAVAGAAIDRALAVWREAGGNVWKTPARSRVVRRQRSMERIRFTISIAPCAHSEPLFPALVPARSIACSMESVVSTPNSTGTPVSRLVCAIPFETSLHT